MFGLQNFSGSCWVNTCLQVVFRIPEIQERYNKKVFEKDNLIDECLMRIWDSKGTIGLKEFFQAVRTKTMPAGAGIGDSHELLHYICDKLPFLDKLFRFTMASSIECNSCKYKEIKEDTVIDFSISTDRKNIPLKNCIAEVMTPYTIDDWKCDKCNKLGCTKQQLMGSFPKVIMFHKPSNNGTIEYSSILILNGREYVLIGVCAFNGGHWWAYGRNMPPGSSWFTLNDKRIEEHGPKQFPVSSQMYVLIYYRLEN
jgi:ubiquitin C-terminal hydrolase